MVNCEFDKNKNAIDILTPVMLNLGCDKAYIENCINSATIFSFKSEKTEEEKENMRKITQIKNCSIKKDGRYRWQKMIDGKRYEIVDSDAKVFLSRLAKIKKQLKQIKDIQTSRKRAKFILFDECIKFVQLYKGNAEHGQKLLGVVKNHMSCLNKDIREYTQDDMQIFRNKLSAYKKVDKQCMLVLKPVFNNAVLKGLIKMSPIEGTKSMAIKSAKREWFEPSEQKKILENLSSKKCNLGDELLFYFLTGCRCEEAFFVTPYWDKNIIFIKGTKTENAPRYVKLSQKASDYFKPRWGSMFKHLPHYYSKYTTIFLNSIGIKNKSLHCVRHSFSTNIFYLGVPESLHQYFMGHGDIKMTKNIYTKFDPTIVKEDILDVWGDWYPTDFVLKSVLNDVPKNTQNIA